MKHFHYLSVLITIMVLSFFVSNANGAETLEDLSEIDGVEYIYISESTLRSMGYGIDLYGIDILHAASSLTDLEVITCDHPIGIKKIKAKIVPFVKRLNLLSKIKDDSESVEIYGKSQGKYYNKMMVIVDEDGEYVIVYMQGKIDPVILKGLTYY